MVRSLYSAISGLRNHQVRLDVIGDNISNVNTTGYKAGRVTFEESMAQLLKGASRPPGDQGGTNPIQVGLGMSVGSVDTLLTQGNLESTGQVTDLAIEGDSFFVVSNGQGNFFTRNGAFQFDSEGRMVLPTNGFVLQGRMAAQDGTFPVGTAVSDIQIPFTAQTPANESTFVDFAGNLNSDSEPLGTVLYTQSFYHAADEYNTSAMSTAGVDNNSFGISDGATPGAPLAAWSATGAVTMAAIATDASLSGGVKLTGLRDGDGRDLGIRTSDIITVTATIDDGTGTNTDETETASFEVVDDPAQAGQTSATQYQVSTLPQLLIAMEDFLNGGASGGLGSAWRAGLGGGSGADGTKLAIMPDGHIRLENQGPIMGGTSTQAIKNLTVKTDRPISTTFVSSAFTFDGTIDVDELNVQTADRLLRPALATDNIYSPLLYDNTGVSVAAAAPVSQIYNGTGELIDLQDNDTFVINAQIGDTPKNSNSLVFDEGTTTVATSTTMQQLLDEIQNTLNLPQRDGTLANNLSVDMNAVGTDDDLIPEGSIVIRGRPETPFSINNFTLSATNADITTPSPVKFNANMVGTQLQAARDTGVYDTSIEVFDESGGEHALTMTFTHTGIKNPGTWKWEVSTSGGENIISGRTGEITFGLDGSPSSFTFDDQGVSTVTIDPGNGARFLDIDLNVGSPGSFLGLTQYEAATTAAAIKQDGYTTGSLEEISIDEFGQITGRFSNGISKALAQIMTADFINPGGLLKVGDSVYATSSNSGGAVLGIPGVSSAGKIRPGALEMSNVEISTEFTNMITTQRGFQANARVITTSDSMLQELVNLVR